jgi:hypothetical protein
MRVGEVVAFASPFVDFVGLFVVPVAVAVSLAVLL